MASWFQGGVTDPVTGSSHLSAEPFRCIETFPVGRTYWESQSSPGPRANTMKKTIPERVHFAIHRDAAEETDYGYGYHDDGVHAHLYGFHHLIDRCNEADALRERQE